MSGANYDIAKWVWTERDFERMGWHDVTVHAFAFRPTAFELMLNIDYIFEWVDPAVEETHFKFWVAPATLVFENVHDLRIDLETNEGIDLQGIEKENPRKPLNAMYIDRNVEWRWVLTSDAGEISLHSTGFKQYIRRNPISTKLQTLEADVRGGISFYRGRCESEESGSSA